MSATNRGAERMEDDAYPTPAWAVRRLLEDLRTRDIPLRLWHEVTAGTGNIIRAVNDFESAQLGYAPVSWIATEINENATLAQVPRLSTVRFADYLTAPAVRCDVAITNPPFSIAEDVIKKALTEADWVVMLLRMNFLGSDDRANWLRNEMPDIDTLPDRPNFIASYKCRPRDSHDRGCGWTAKLPISDERIRVCPACGRGVDRSSSDSIEYGWFIWTPERGRTSGVTRILASTPAEERGVKARRRKPKPERQAA